MEIGQTPSPPKNKTRKRERGFVGKNRTSLKWVITMNVLRTDGTMKLSIIHGHAHGDLNRIFILGITAVHKWDNC